MSPRRWLPHARAILLYAVVAVVFSWPLPARLGTHLTGPLDSDAAVYVWNQWVFQHELVENRSLPYFTGKIFSLNPKANLSLHNYTTFANLLALPLIPRLGVVTTFNVVFLFLTVLTAYAMYLFARELTHGAEAEALLAGALFAWCPFLVTRGAGHFSLVAAAPLPIFLMLLLRTPTTWSWRDGIALGLVMAWAASSDAYYGVFCLVLAAVVLTASVFRLRRAEPTTRSAAIVRSVDVLIVILVGLIAAILLSRGWRVTFLGRALSFRSLYTPVLILTTLVLVRTVIRYPPTLMKLDAAGLIRLARVGAITALACAAVLAPVLYAVGLRLADDRGFGSSHTFWRSSPPGVDLIALVLPNPNHPIMPESVRGWLAAQRNGYLENVASIPLAAIGVIAFAWWRGWRAQRTWIVVAATFGLLSLGPFIRIAGANTYIPGPWALLRYVPIVELTRSPGRFFVVLMLAVAAMFALALQWMTSRYAERRRVIVAIVATLLVVELLPIPRPTYAATIPAFYQRIAADPRPDVRVLELPFGIRDGTRSVGNFTARSQFFQTFHKKPLIGGYLSRVSRRRLHEIQQSHMLSTLVTLSEGRPITEAQTAILEERALRFITRANVGYVVIDRARAPAGLVTFALRVFRLKRIDGEGAQDLYEPGV